MLRVMQCPHDGTRRLLLNILHHLPVPKPVNAAFLISAFKACCLLPKAHPDKLSA